LPLIAALLAAGCGSDQAQRAQLSSVQATTGGVSGAELDVVQRLRFSEPMLAALDAGIALPLQYQVDACDGLERSSHRLELRYAPLTRRYEMRLDAGEARRFVRRSALLAALDRIQLPLASLQSLDCSGSLELSLPLAGLPAPLRIPALLQPEEWSLHVPATAWTGRSGTAAER
jgi:hypothetical protein